MSFEGVLLVSFLLAIFIIIIIKANLEYYSKENIEARKRKNNEEYNPMIHKDCEGCNGTGLDPMGSCYDCDGRGFVEKTYQEKFYN